MRNLKPCRRKNSRVKECYNSEEWKSLRPISALSGPSLVLSGPSTRPTLGPLFFNPIPSTRLTILSSPSLLPPFPPIRTLALPPLRPHDLDPACDLRHETTSASFSHNRLQSLRWPGPTADTSLLFFPTGENSDRVGFLALSTTGAHGGVSSAGCGGLGHRISRIWVNPTAGSDAVVGYLLASSVYSVHWFVVTTAAAEKPGEVPSLVYLGSKVFKGGSVAGACWSPHLPEESAVLLESGALFLFDSEPWLRPGNENPRRKGTRLKVSWDDHRDGDGDFEWLSCEFSWHPRIMVVARSDAVFVVDLRQSSGHCRPAILMKIETLCRLYAPEKTERFLALAKAGTGSDHFHFAVVSDSLLVLCDMRKPFTPVLQWVHGLPEPRCVSVFGLADLRWSDGGDDPYKQASESGVCIVLGSFWNSEFKLFRYGTTPCGETLSWEIPSKLSLLGDECGCGSCLLSEDVSRNSLLPGLEWQRKRKIILGFSVTRREKNGFTLVRLTSSGDLESQRYSASWQPGGGPRGVAHLPPRYNDHLMRCRRHASGRRYRLGRKLTHLELDYLGKYLRCSELMSRGELRGDESSTQELHESLCERLSSASETRVPLPLSVHEVASTRIWARAGTGLLQLALSCDPESADYYLEVSGPSQLPPFLLRNPGKGSYTDALTGIVIPLSVIRSMGEESGRFSLEKEYSLVCDEVVKMVSSSEADVCLSDDLDQTTGAGSQKVKPKFVLHKPNSFRSESGDNKEEVFSTMVTKLVEKDSNNKNNRASVGMEMFDSVCPIQMEFGGDATKFTTNKLTFLRFFKKQCSIWQREFDLYQDFCSNSLT